MKKLLVLLLLLPVIMQAQVRNFSFKAGVYTPYDLKSGMVYGIDYGSRIDRDFTLMISADLYYKSIINDAYSGSSEKLGVRVKSGQRLSEWVGWHLPVTLKVRYDLPLRDTPVSPFFIAGLGYGVTHLSYDTFNSDNSIAESVSTSYNGVVWQLGAGFSYPVGRATRLMFEVLHNNAVFEKEEKYNQFSELNSSGVMIRFGIDFMFR